jgi:hypothetical protein
MLWRFLNGQTRCEREQELLELRRREVTTMEGGGGGGMGRSGETTVVIDGLGYSPEAYWRRLMLERQDRQIALLTETRDLLRDLIDLTSRRG